MQAIEFEADLHNGNVQLPLAYRDWYNQTVKVILLRNEAPKTLLEENIWHEVETLRQQLKKQAHSFSDSAELIRKMRK